MVFTLIQIGQSLCVSVSSDIRSHWPIAINMKMNNVNSKVYAVDFISRTFLRTSVLTPKPHDPVGVPPLDVFKGRLRAGRNLGASNELNRGFTYLLTPWSRVLLEKLTSKLCS